MSLYLDGRGFPGGASGKEPSCQGRRRERCLIPGSGRSLGGQQGNPLQYSRLENPWTEESCGLESIGPQRVGHD